MKKLTILFIAYLLFPNQGFTQEYQAMLQESAEWYVYHWSEISCNETYSIQGDSIVNDVVYKKFTANPYCEWNSAEITLLREDTINRRVYRLLYDTTEAILYDFSLQPGDSVVIKTEPNRQHIVYLDSISNHFPNHANIDIPENARIFYCKVLESYEVIWIEGIGSLTGPLTSEYAWNNGISEETLLCHYNKGIKTYNDRQQQVADCKGLEFSNTEESAYTHDLKIYPIPSAYDLQIQSTDDTRIIHLEVIDYMGKLLMTKDNINHSATTLDISGLAQGIYLVKVVLQDERVVVKKFVRE